LTQKQRTNDILENSLENIKYRFENKSPKATLEIAINASSSESKEKIVLMELKYKEQIKEIGLLEL
jgi:hypothetical protein